MNWINELIELLQTARGNEARAARSSGFARAQSCSPAVTSQPVTIRVGDVITAVVELSDRVLVFSRDWHVVLVKPGERPE